MITIQGKWFDGRTSAQVDAVLKVYDNGAWRLVRQDNGDLLHKNTRFSFKVSPRLAGTPRYLSLDQGQSFETSDNLHVDEILAIQGRSHWSLKVHLLESKLRYVIPVLVLCIVMAVVTVKYGIPAASRFIAGQLPDVVYRKAGEQTMNTLDKMILKPSTLEPHVAQRVRSHLQSIIDHHPHLSIRVHFRKGGPFGPNAFALPDGQIVFTEEMIEIAENDDEILAVMAHEIGHVVHRHGMRRMIQDSLLSFAILSLTGDASGVSELFLGLPAVLTELSYSRDFERDADRYALTYLRTHHIPAQHFAAILTRISQQEPSQKKSGDAQWSNYLSTHPPTPERVSAFLEAAGGHKENSPSRP